MVVGQFVSNLLACGFGTRTDVTAPPEQSVDALRQASVLGLRTSLRDPRGRKSARHGPQARKERPYCCKVRPELTEARRRVARQAYG